ncbi:MAG: response regulator [Beijerinckiaceae bacterium]
MTSASTPRILVVDDDISVRELLRECLEPEGFAVEEASDGAAMFAALRAGKVDLITLDLMLKGESGLTIARRVREERDTPIIMITGRGDMVDRVVGLELGADDYISKPFHPREVVARIRAVLRRQSSKPAGSPGELGETLAFDGMRLDIGRRELRDRAGVLIELTTAEFNLLEVFVRRAQRVLSRDALMDLLKGHDWTPLDRSLDALVSRLRRKLGEDPDHPKLIKTVRGVGYSFVAAVAAA